MLFSAHYAAFFLIQWQVLYALRIQGSTHRKLVVNDYRWVIVSALIVSSLYKLSALLFGFFTLVFILQWVNIIVLRFYGIKVNWHILKAFFTGVGHFQHEAAAIWPELRQDNKLLLFLPLTIILYAAYFFMDFVPAIYSATLFSVYFLMVLTKSKLTRKTLGIWVLGLLVLSFIVYVLLPMAWLKMPSAFYFYEMILLGSVAWLFIAKIFLASRTTPFYQLPTMLQQQFRDEHLKLDESESISLSKADIKLTEFIPEQLTPSALFGRCANANIILITVESLSGYYFRSADQQKQYLPFYHRLKQHGVSSSCHISPSALTNNMCKIVYGGEYQTEQFPHLQRLVQAGYQTCFLTSQKATEFNMDKLLVKIGFQHIIDNVLMSRNQQTRLSDREFFEAVTPLLEERVNMQQPFFLHILNNQTHGPYFTYDRKVLDRKERYEQAVYEADQNIERFIHQLRQRVDLNNTIIIYTGDHGESFGEEGYTSHANSIIQPQIEVPFVLAHPQLSQMTIPISTHFDLFPTLFDLLGIACDYPVLGQSLFNSTKSEHCLVYSETRMGNTPSSFGLVTPNQKIYFDRQMGKYELRNLNDEVLEVLAGEKYKYYLKLLLLGLQNTRLIEK